VEIRKIQKEDSEKYLEFMKKLDNETKYMMYEPDERKSTLKDIEEMVVSLDASDSILLIAVDNNDIVGFISAERGFANRIKHIAYIVTGILKGYRGKHIGTRLFEALEVWARHNGIFRFELTVMTHNEAAIHLYKKMGFKVEGIKEKSMIVDEELVDEYYMGKLL